MYILFLQLLLSNFCTYVPFLKKKKKTNQKVLFYFEVKKFKVCSLKGISLFI